ncbi:MAG: hypothetical protein KGZ30_00440 [Anaplasmataceae bacterium]|nr:hypothetical protein [Anaplasmataceae bacterium]
MNKKTILIAVLILSAAAAIYFGLQCPCLQKLATNIDLSGVNFSKLGYVSDREPENFNEGLYFVYEEPGAPALSVKLVFDEKSYCTFGEQSILCMALSVTIDTATEGRRMSLEGTKEGEMVYVRNLKTIEE